jgi:hypothetical protein
MADEITEPFDPADHSVKDVVAYLDANEDPGEKARVLQAEREGKARAGVLDTFVDPVNPADEVEQAEAAQVLDHREDAEAMGYDLVDVTEDANNPPVQES